MEKLEPSYLDGGNVKIVQPLWKTVWQFLKKLNTELPYNPAITLLGIYSKKLKKNFFFKPKLVHKCS